MARGFAYSLAIVHIAVMIFYSRCGKLFTLSEGNGALSPWFAYLPLNTGSLFSRKAAVPSTASSVICKLPNPSLTSSRTQLQ